MFIRTFNGSVSAKLTDDFMPLPDQIRHSLGRLDGTEDFAYLLYYVPDDAGWPDAPGYDDSKYDDEYMQSAGSADAMTIEVKRREDDGELRHYVIGRPGDDADAPDVEVRFSEYSQLIRPTEVFDANEAAQVYYAYFQTRTVPDTYVLRELDLSY